MPSPHARHRTHVKSHQSRTSAGLPEPGIVRCLARSVGWGAGGIRESFCCIRPRKFNLNLSALFTSPAYWVGGLECGFSLADVPERKKAFMSLGWVTCCRCEPISITSGSKILEGVHGAGVLEDRVSRPSLRFSSLKASRGPSRRLRVHGDTRLIRYQEHSETEDRG